MAMAIDDRTRQDKIQPPEREAGERQKQRAANTGESTGGDPEIGRDGAAIVGGAPGKVIDNVGGPGLGVPPGGANRKGKKGASGSTEG